MSKRAIDANALYEIADKGRVRGMVHVVDIDRMEVLTLNTLRDEIYRDAIKHGLFEEFDQIKDPVKRRRKLAMRIMEEAAEMYAAADDPEHYAEEAADVTLITGDVCGYLGIDWHGAVMSKKEYNKTRPWKHEEAKTMKAMISQPMGGKSNEEIVETRERAIAALEEKGFEVVNTLFTDEWYSNSAMKERGVENVPLCFLAKSIENMSLCNAAYFCKGWEHARGCRIEHEAAKAYNMTILYEE